LAGRQSVTHAAKNDRFEVTNWGRCFDHNFPRFSTIFCGKNWRLFLEN
jgi:hypothetical protein